MPFNRLAMLQLEGINRSKRRPNTHSKTSPANSAMNLLLMFPASARSQAASDSRQKPLRRRRKGLRRRPSGGGKMPAGFARAPQRAGGDFGHGKPPALRQCAPQQAGRVDVLSALVSARFP